MKFAFAVKYLALMESASNDNWGTRPVTMVAIGCEDTFGPMGQTPLRPVIYLSFADLTHATFRDLAPTTVIIPLFSGANDALEMIKMLQDFGYARRILVIGPILPNPAMVERELRAAGPQRRLTLISA